MTFLGPQSDRAVRTAVEAYMDGRLRPEVDGEAVFETRNSRYRLMDGTLFSATDSSLVGAELVGWLTESIDNCQVSAWWRPGARAVLVDRRAGRHIVVTSATRLLKVDNAPPTGSGRPRGGSIQGQLQVHQVQPQSVRPSSPVEPLPNMQPLPVPPAPPVPRLEVERAAQAPSTRPAQRAPVHPPPRPIAPRAPMASSAPPPASARPLPFPAPPPRQGAVWGSADAGPLPRFDTATAVGPTRQKERPTEELSLSDISVVEELPSFEEPQHAQHAAWPPPQPQHHRAPIANPSSDDNLPTMRKRVAPRARPAPPPPGPLASARGRAAPPGPGSEPFPLSRGHRGAPLR